MRVLVIGIIAAAVIATVAPAFSQVSLLFPHGVASGDVRETSALLWTRPSRLAPVTVEVSADPQFGSIAFQRTVTPNPERDLTVKVLASGLAPATRYYYRFRAGRGAYSQQGAFVTPPAADASADLTFAYSACSDGGHVGGVPALSLGLLDAVVADRPDFFAHLGDNMYPDSSLVPNPVFTLEAYRGKYKEIRSIPTFRNFTASTSMIVTWDDHEVENDYDRETVDARRWAEGHRAFMEYSPIAEQPGGRIYRKFRWGREIELFVLDGRSYRSRHVSKTAACDNPPGGRVPDLAPTLPPPIRAAFAPLVPQMRLPVPPGCLEALADPNRTMLGIGQKLWLKQELARSTATWKLILNQTPIQEFFALPYDRWEGYAAERVEILTFIRDSGIKNVVWLTGDTHATLVNDVRLSTFAPPFATAGMKEVVTGPIAATPYAESVAGVGGRAVVPALLAFFTAPVPQGVGMSCAVMDRYTYAKVEVSSRARTVTITPKDAAGRPICRAPLVITATP